MCSAVHGRTNPAGAGPANGDTAACAPPATAKNTTTLKHERIRRRDVFTERLGVVKNLIAVRLLGVGSWEGARGRPRTRGIGVRRRHGDPSIDRPTSAAASCAA